jgi:hypothetical protein
MVFAAAATAVSLFVIVIFDLAAARSFGAGGDQDIDSRLTFSPGKQHKAPHGHKQLPTDPQVLGALDTVVSRLVGILKTQPFQPAAPTAVGGRDGLMSLPLAMVQQSKGSHALCLAAMGLHIQALDSFLATPGVKQLWIECH